MRIFYYPCLFSLSLLFLCVSEAKACGYGYVGDCSTQIKLRINNSLDSFKIATCPSGPYFDGLQLGTIQSLSLAGANSINWESCFNNVTAVALRYRIHEDGQPGSTWFDLNLQENYNTLVGPYTTRYRSASSNISLTTGLTIGKTYVLEVYFLAQIDTLGDDFIPETILAQNNNGQNYHLTFTYGGPAAGPFTVVKTLLQDVTCHGSSTGVAGVTVYGNQNSLFYTWSAIGGNFYTIYNAPAGAYTVTVTGVNGYTQSKTIQIAEPQALANTFLNVEPVGCNSTGGHATALATGGAAPYTYHWNSGDTTALATVFSSGTWTVTVTDSNACTAHFAVVIPGNGGAIVQNLTATFCAGTTYHISNQNFTQPGLYTFIKTSATGCDTTVHLTLQAGNPGATLLGLPAAITVTCANPAINLCATTASNVTFAWTKDGVPAVTTPCLLATAGGNYAITATYTNANTTCIATKYIVSEEHLLPPTASFSGLISEVCGVLSTDSIILYATTDAVGPTYRWTYNGQVISTAATCTFLVPGAGDLPTLVVTDLYGCSTEASKSILVVVTTMPNIFIVNDKNLCNGLHQIQYIVSGGAPPYELTVDGSSTLSTNSFTAAAGGHTIQLTDANGCVTYSSIYITPFAASASVLDATSSSATDGFIHTTVGGGNAPVLIQWDNGQTGPDLDHLAPGTYCATFKDSGNCTFDTCFVISYPNATLDPVSQKLQFFPNPARANSTLEMILPQAFIGTETRVDIIDGMGRSFKNEQFEAMQSHITTFLPSDLPVGIYLVRLHNATTQVLGALLIVE